jgi:hypothetical protein
MRITQFIIATRLVLPWWHSADLLIQIVEHNDLALTRLISCGRTFCEFLLFEMVDRRNVTERLITA